MNYVQYGDVMRIVNQYGPLKGYLMTYETSPTEGYGVYTSPETRLNESNGDWQLVKLLQDGSEETGEVSQYGDIVRLVNQFDPSKGYLLVSGNHIPTEGYNVYTSPGSRLSNGPSGDWKLVKILPNGSEVSDGPVLAGDKMRFVNQYNPSKGYLMTFGNHAPTEGFGVYTSPQSKLEYSVGDWVFETF
jgi:hypothetical protein